MRKSKRKRICKEKRKKKIDNIINNAIRQAIVEVLLDVTWSYLRISEMIVDPQEDSKFKAEMREFLSKEANRLYKRR